MHKDFSGGIMALHNKKSVLLFYNNRTQMRGATCLVDCSTAQSYKVTNHTHFLTQGR